MRRLLLLPLLALAACDSASDGPPVPFAVRVLGSFDDAHVRVRVDEAVILDETLTTNYVLGLTRIAEADVREGRRRIRVEVDGRVLADRRVRVGSGSREGCVSVGYTPPGKASITEGCPRFYF